MYLLSIQQAHPPPLGYTVNLLLGGDNNYVRYDPGKLYQSLKCQVRIYKPDVNAIPLLTPPGLS